MKDAARRGSVGLLASMVISVVATVPAHGEWPWKRRAAMVGPAPRVVARPILQPRPRAIVTPNGITDVPGLGTFYPDPQAVVTTGYPGSTYTPFGQVSQADAMAVYGPISRFRPVVGETTVYSRGYNGVLEPTGSATVYSTPALDPRARTPNTYRLPDGGIARPELYRGNRRLYPPGEY